VRIANLAGRATLLGLDGTGLDVEKASDGAFPADPQALYGHWDRLREWAVGQENRAEIAIDPAELGPPVPAPSQVFAIGLNYADHVAESRLGRPDTPAVFTKFPTSITGPNSTVALPCATVDWEVELVVAIGRRAFEVGESKAWDHVAGLMVGQDLSERVLQLAGPAPQFSLGKSYPGFAPIGPWLVTPDALAAPDDLELGCRIGEEVLQLGRTGDLIFGVPELIARLSAVCPLLPGDLIFTGTPAGVGQARTPQRFLAPGEVLTSHIEGIGELRNELIAGPRRPAITH
jgi:2-keto-4-pentenoate hydratase/2-oxohepta-3-ene-1,7-dioic acid hydratase in catechol pathway